LLAPALFAAAACAAAGSPAHGQYSPNPAGMPGAPPITQPTQQSGVVAQPTAPPGSYAPPPVNVNQFAPGYGPYAGVPYGNPWASGGLTGAANAINAQGEFEKQFQQARLMNQDVERSKLDTRRQKIEQWEWERNNIPTMQQNRERDQYWELRRVLNNPPSIEIWNGSAMNTILAAIQQVQRSGAPGPVIYLPPGAASQLSLTTGVTNTGVGLLKNGYKLTWPLSLQDDAFDSQRAAIDRLMKDAYDQLTGGSVDGKTLRKLDQSINQLNEAVRAQVEAMTPSDYVRAQRYVRELRDTFQALRQPDPAAFFASNRTAPAATVGELIQNMAAKGQKFAPAISGNEPAYNAVYSALATYYTALTQPTMRSVAAAPAAAPPGPAGQP
jgi:hypothetical protein